MAERRMLAKSIVESDAFLDMPLSTQALYMHLVINADDDGFLNNAKKIQRLVGANDDDMKILLSKRFIIPFESGVVVIKHWLMQNAIRKDRYVPTAYQVERSQLLIKENKSYTEQKDDGCQLVANWLPNGMHRSGQNSLVKDNINQIYQDSINNISIQKGSICDGLTDEQFTLLDDTFEDFKDLIDLIDDRLKLSSLEIKNPYAYIVKVAREERWMTKA